MSEPPSSPLQQGKQHHPAGIQPFHPSSSQRGTGTGQVRSPIQDRREAIPETACLPGGGQGGGQGQSPRKHQMPALLSDEEKIPRNAHKEGLTLAPSATIH